MGSSLILLVLIVGTALYLIGIYNGLISKKVATQSSWSQIDVQLKRRHDLIPNLVETVKGYASHEQQTLEKVIQARNAAVSLPSSASVEQHAQAENMLTGALRQIFALSENYPDLKANQNFLALQEELSSTENRIGFARQNYNDTAALYNTAQQQFPGSFVAGFGSFKLAEFYQLDEAEAKAVRETPKVAF